jgi:hypothetical protein
MSDNNKSTRNIIVILDQCQVPEVSGPVEAIKKANVGFSIS